MERDKVGLPSKPGQRFLRPAEHDARILEVTGGDDRRAVEVDGRLARDRLAIGVERSVGRADLRQQPGERLMCIEQLGSLADQRSIAFRRFVEAPKSPSR